MDNFLKNVASALGKAIVILIILAVVVLFFDIDVKAWLVKTDLTTVDVMIATGIAVFYFKD